jgi:hypothetical protein
LVGDLGEDKHLVGGNHSGWDLGADHLHACLALAVDATAETESAKLVVGDTAGDERFSLLTEFFDIFANDAVVIGFDYTAGIEDGALSHDNLPFLYRDYYNCGRQATRITINSSAMTLLRLAFLVGIGAWPAASQLTPEAVEFFEKRIRPVLAERCYPCHSAKVKEPLAGLRLDTRAGVLKGSLRGPVVVPGDPESSRLILAISYKDAHLQMPPKGKLPDSAIADLTAWVKMGLPDPRTEEITEASRKGIDYERARKHWAFQPLKQAAGTIDDFLAAKLAASKLKSAPPADRRTVIRRAYFDLIGLPPTPAEVAAFLNDTTPGAYEKVVDRLLASPHYGERWARHWLDLARYAETDGHEFDVDKPNAWRYRDYVIRAFNSDLPYDRFLMEQIAGDLLPKDRVIPGAEDVSVGTGFHYLGEVINTPVETFQALADNIDNQIDVFGKSFLGLTIACARCHDHKFDPIPTADYYALAGIFRSTRRRQTCIDSPDRVREIEEIARSIEQVDREIEAAGADLPSRRLAPGEVKMTAAYEIAEDFSKENFEGWKVTGQAFGAGPRDGVADSGRISDRMQGILISPQFLIEKRFIHVRMGGRGMVRLFADEYTNAARTLKGDGGPMAWRRIDARMGQGNLAYIEISDLDREGHIEVDRILYSDQPQPPETAPARSIDLKPAPPELLAKRRALELKIPLSTFALTAVEDEPRDIPIHLRGNHKTLGAVVPRRFLTVFAGDNQARLDNGSGRLQLAQRMLDTAKPLVARVMVNRIWKHHFGTGLVPTVDNFGMSGDRPSHPELLDALASEFIQSGWSVKKLHRRMVLSNAYRMSTRGDPAADRVDPDNRLLHRMPVRRLDAEIIRDSMLAVSGALDRQLYGPGPVPWVSPFMDSDPRGKPESGPLDGGGRRSIYINVRRNFLTDLFLTFDYPQPISTTGRRNVSTVPAQALAMMNSKFVAQQAARWARRVIAEAPDALSRVERLYLEAFARPPTAEEKATLLELGQSLERKYTGPYPDAEARAWTDVCHVLFNTTEFIYVR